MGWGLAGSSGIAAFRTSVAVNLLPSTLVSEMRSEDTSPNVVANLCGRRGIFIFVGEEYRIHADPIYD